MTQPGLASPPHLPVSHRHSLADTVRQERSNSNLYFTVHTFMSLTLNLPSGKIHGLSSSLILAD